MAAPIRERPVVSSVQAGDLVIVWNSPEARSTESQDWWMGEVLCVEDSGQDPQASRLLQVVDVDTGLVCLVNEDQIQQVRLPIHTPFTAL
ncbi:DUF3104 domain-containing protein [Synechococcus sp. M16CYN]|uniref:DUF3104 domain-containing protein n=1 Tax=Synechococcus sp. M16CYN TaxID=3103139 RepID=UPI00333F929D